MQTCMCFDDDECAGVCMRAASVLFEQSILLQLGSITINNILLIIFPVLLIPFFFPERRERIPTSSALSTRGVPLVSFYWLIEP